MDPMTRIRIDPEVRGGKPTIRGTRITVHDILEYLASGMSEEEILADFPDLAVDDVRAAAGLRGGAKLILPQPDGNPASRIQPLPVDG